MLYVQTNVDLTALVGQGFTGDQFATKGTIPDYYPGTLDNQLPRNIDPSNNWINESGPAWTEGNGASLTYTVSSVNNAYQVIGIAVAQTDGTPVTTIYGQLITFSADTLFLGGFEGFDPATGSLTMPLSAVGGRTDYFVMSDLAYNAMGTNYDHPTDYDATAAPSPFGTVGLAAACFATGTQISTSAGPVAVERLAVGDMVVTHDGAHQPIRWIGHTHYACGQAAQPARLCPVRVQAGAFGPALPQRDLFLSPEHAVFAGGALVPIRHLVNGTSIQQRPAAEVTYYHVALNRHGVLLAEGLPAESYIETGSLFGQVETAHRRA